MTNSITTSSGTLVTIERDGNLIGITATNGHGSTELELSVADLRELIAASRLHQVLADAEADPLTADEKEQICALTRVYETGSPHLQAALAAVTS